MRLPVMNVWTQALLPSSGREVFLIKGNDSCKVSAVMSPADIDRALTRIGHEIVERNRDIENLILVGIHTRGVPLAHRLSTIIKSFQKMKISVASLDITLYRDDIYQKFHHSGQITDLSVDISNKRVVLVDDVLSTGRTIRAAMDALLDFGRPTLIQVAVLIDRGHRELPIRADYVGKNLPTAITDQIRVRLTETDGHDKVILIPTRNP